MEREHATDTFDPVGPPKHFEERRQEIGSLMKRFNTMRRLYRGPWTRTFERGHMLLLITTGRTSGRPRTVALTFMPSETATSSALAWASAATGTATCWLTRR